MTTTGIQAPVLPDEVARRPLHFFWLVDGSGSMAGQKIASLNQAIREAIPEVRKATATHPEVQILMRAIRFASVAEWFVGPAPVDMEQFVWPELSAGGSTATARAIELLSSELALDKMPRRGYPPVCILISDGACTDPTEEYEKAIAGLNALPWGKKAVRLALAIGENEGDYDEAQLLKFVSHPEIGVLKAHNPQELLQYIRWASVSASVGASAGKSKAGDSSSGNVALPTPPPPVVTSSNDVF